MSKEQFEKIVLKTDKNGKKMLIKNGAEVELGARSYDAKN